MGLLGTAAKVAVASSVHGRVQRRQQTKWAAQDSAQQPAAAPQAPPAAPAAAAASGGMLEQLKQLGELRDGGVLTDAEFEAQKARILAA